MPQAFQELAAWKRTHLTLNEQLIDKAMEENEKDLKRTLYHSTISAGQVSPWLDS
jgi:hypothetical protein